MCDLGQELRSCSMSRSEVMVLLKEHSALLYWKAN